MWLSRVKIMNDAVEAMREKGVIVSLHDWILFERGVENILTERDKGRVVECCCVAGAMALHKNTRMTFGVITHVDPMTEVASFDAERQLGIYDQFGTNESSFFFHKYPEGFMRGLREAIGPDWDEEGLEEELDKLEAYLQEGELMAEGDIEDE